MPLRGEPVRFVCGLHILCDEAPSGKEPTLPSPAPSARQACLRPSRLSPAPGHRLFLHPRRAACRGLLGNAFAVDSTDCQAERMFF